MYTGPTSPAPSTGRSGASPWLQMLAVAERLRRVRVSRHLTLHDVEAMTSGEFKASVLGAYERGDRSLSIRRLARLAEVYGVDPAQLLSAEDEIDLRGLQAEEDEIDLRGLQAEERRARPTTGTDLPLAAVARLSADVRTRRRELVFTPLTLRASDVEFLGILFAFDQEQLDELLAQFGLSAPRGRRDSATVS
jgi:transcriptional regulator with XRE-family HTH domain